MARGMGGGDNVMGSKEAVVNVAFKDDLGNILENAEKLKDVLDAVNQNFLAINSVVGITSNSMGRLTSQTQRLVSTTQQLRNEYQIIADASQRIGVSAPQQPVAINQAPFQDTEVIREALSGSTRGATLLGKPEEAAMGRTAGLDKLQTGKFPRVESPFRAQRPIPTHTEVVYDDDGNPVTDEEGKPIYRKVPTKERYSGPNKLKNAWDDYQAGASPSRILSEFMKASSNPMVAAMGAAVPYVQAAYMVGSAAYKAADYLVKGATRYTGLTGGTGIFENTGAARGSASFIDLQTRAWREGIFNMAVGPGGFQQIQEALLGAGYTARGDSQYDKMGIRGMRYEAARSSLQRMYEVGLQDVDANLQLMQLVTERGNGSLTTLMGTIDNLRTTALKTNASLKVMQQTMSASITGLIGGMNVMGGVATFVGGTNAAAYANAQNSLLRGSGAPDYNNFITQMMMLQSPELQSAGVNPNNMFYMMSNPELFPGGQGLTLAKATDYSVDRVLGMAFNVPKGASVQQAKDILGQNSNRVRALMQSPMIQALVKDPAIYQNADAFIEWAATNLTGNPQTASAEASRRANLGRAIDIDRWDRGPGSYYAKRYPDEAESSRLTRDQAINKYFQSTFGTSMGVSFDEDSGKMNMTGWGMSSWERDDHPLLARYYDYSMNTGQRLGFIEKTLKSSNGRAAGSTYFKFGDRVMSWNEYFDEMKTNKALQAASRGEGGTTLMMGQKKKGESEQDIRFMDAAEFGGGGNMGENKTLQNMTKDDFADSINTGLKRFANSNKRLNVFVHDS